MATSNGKITLSHSESLREQLDSISECLGDYRVSKYGRDIGILCTSPKINPASLRRPIHTGGFVKAADMEATKQRLDYGYDGFQTYSKLTTGAGTTKAFVDKIKSTSEGSNLWIPSSPHSSDIPGTWEFDGYNHKAKYIGESDVIYGLKERVVIANGVTIDVFSIPAEKEGYSYTANSELQCYQSAIFDKIKLRFSLSDTSVRGECVFKVNAYVMPMYGDQAAGREGEGHYFQIDTTGHQSGDTWTDIWGSEITMGADSGGRWYVEITLSMMFFPTVTNITSHTLKYRIYDISNYSYTTTDNGTKYQALSVRMTSGGVINFEPSLTEKNSMGFFIQNDDSWYSEEWTTAKQGQPTPYDHFFTNRGITDRKPMLIIVAKSRLTATETVVVNPYHEYGDLRFNGYVIYENLPFSEACLSSLETVHAIKIYGTTAMIPNNTGYTDAYSITDGYKWVCPPFAYIQTYGAPEA